MQTVNILGTEYTIEYKNAQSDRLLDTCSGYVDKTSRKIVIETAPHDNELDDFEVYSKKVLRHEIIHAFLFESGLHESWTHEDGHDETYVDWIAVQFPKLLKAFTEAEAM